MSGKILKKSKAGAAPRRTHTEEFRRETLLLAARTGVAAAASELGIQPSLLYGWQTKARAARECAQVEQAQAAEIARLKRQLDEQTAELAIPKKKSGGVLRSREQVKYAFIREREGEFRVVTMCRGLEVSTSGYYDWRCRNPS